MKLLIRSLALFLALSSVALAQKIDVTKRPDPLPAKSISFPPYKEIMLKNGLKVFLVEDHEQPTVAFTLQIRSGETSDGAKAGLANITADMLTKGAGKRTALEIAEKLDSIAIGIQSGSVGEASTMSFSGLKKHFPLALSIASDMIIRPTFPQEELDKMIPQVLAEIKQEKSRPNNIAAAMSRKVIYGMNHPNARRRTDQSVKSITVEDLKKFHIQSGDTEGLVNYPLWIKGIRLSALIIQRPDEVKLSFRSKGNIDVNELAHKNFNGGGHKNAAGGRSEVSVTQTREKLIAILAPLKNQLNH
mgnify:CR=1 FL=1